MKKGMKKSVFYTLLIVLIAVFLFAAYKLGSYWMEKARSDKLLDDASEFVDIVMPEGSSQEGGDTTAPEKINVDFEALQKLNDDVVAWIYCPDTKINYPVLQTGNNDYYLNHLLDGTYNINGSIFMDYRNESNFTDGNTLIYGHHMQSGAMFASLTKYKDQSHYDAHPYIYVLTPTQNYRLELFAGCIVDCFSPVFSTEMTDDLIAEFMKTSKFKSTVTDPTGPVVTLSTCTYEYDDARFVVLGQLVAIDE